MYTLYIANKNYSSWSLRPWVLMRTLGIEFEEKIEHFEQMVNFDKFRQFSPSGTVPCLVDSLVESLQDGEQVIWDSLAICEYLAETHTAAWPADTAARAFARSVSAEMHSSFSALRNICPMNCAIKVEMTEISGALQKDIDRIDEIFTEGLDRFGGPFLCGESFTIADAFYCPVAFRINSYQLPVSSEALAYVQRLLSLPAMQDWDNTAVGESWREEQHEEEARAAGTIVEDRRLS